MTEIDYHNLVAEAAGEAYELTLDQRFNELREEAKKRVALASPAVPLVFADGAPGYLAIGPLDSCRIVKNPEGVPGLDLAWRILQAGNIVGDILDARILMPDCEHRPANALRNALARAAEWIEDEGACPDLAALLRKPFLQVSIDGRIRVRTARRPPIIFILPAR